MSKQPMVCFTRQPQPTEKVCVPPTSHTLPQHLFTPAEEGPQSPLDTFADLCDSQRRITFRDSSTSESDAPACLVPETIQAAHQSICDLLAEISDFQDELERDPITFSEIPPLQPSLTQIPYRRCESDSDIDLQILTKTWTRRLRIPMKRPNRLVADKVRFNAPGFESDEDEDVAPVDCEPHPLADSDGSGHANESPRALTEDDSDSEVVDVVKKYRAMDSWGKIRRPVFIC